MITITSRTTSNSLKSKIKSEFGVDIDMAETMQDMSSFSLCSHPVNTELLELLTDLLDRELKEGSGVDEIEFKNQTIDEKRGRLVICSHLKDYNKNMDKTALDGLSVDEIVYAITKRPGLFADNDNNILLPNLVTLEEKMLSSIIEKRGLSIEQHPVNLSIKAISDRSINKFINELTTKEMTNYNIEDVEAPLNPEILPYKIIGLIHEMRHIPVNGNGKYLDSNSKQDRTDMMTSILFDGLKDFEIYSANDIKDTDGLVRGFSILAEYCGGPDAVEKAHYLIIDNHIRKLEEQYPMVNRDKIIDVLDCATDNTFCNVKTLNSIREDAVVSLDGRKEFLNKLCTREM